MSKGKIKTIIAIFGLGQCRKLQYRSLNSTLHRMEKIENVIASQEIIAIFFNLSKKK